MIKTNNIPDLTCLKIWVTQILVTSLIVYFFSSIYFKPYNRIEGWMWDLCWLGIMATSFMIVISSLLNREMLLIVILLFQWISSIVLQKSITHNTGSIFGLYAGDGVTYYEYISNIRVLSLTEMAEEYSYINWDDFGMLFALKVIRLMSFNAIDYIPSVFLLVNAVLVVISSNNIYKISSFFISERNSKIAATIYGGNLYWVFISTHFMKENIFMALITFACYYFIKTVNGEENKIFPFLFYTFLTAFFRSICPIIFLLAAISCLFRNMFSRKKFIIIVGLITMLCVFFLSFFIDTFAQLNGNTNLNYEQVMRIFDSRTGFASNRVLGGFIMFISSVFGPFCSIKPGEQNVLLLYSFCFLFKGFLSFFFFFGLYNLFLSNHLLLPFIFTYLFLSILVVVVLSVGLDFRFQTTYYPLLLIVSLYGLENTIANKSSTIVLFVGYSLCLSLLTYFYNMR